MIKQGIVIGLRSTDILQGLALILLSLFTLILRY